MALIGLATMAASLALAQGGNNPTGAFQQTSFPPAVFKGGNVVPSGGRTVTENPIGIVVRYRTAETAKASRSLPRGVKWGVELLVDPSEYSIPFIEQPSAESLSGAISTFRRDPAVLWAEVQYAEAPPHEAVLAYQEREQVLHLIVKEKASFADLYPAQESVRSREVALGLGEIAGVSLVHVRDLWNGARLLRLPTQMSIKQAKDLAAKLLGAGVVEFAEPDAPNRPTFIPNDPRFLEQWHYAALSASNFAGANLPAAWDVTLGSNTLVVAVLDTGIDAAHPDFAGKLVAGYDFVSDLNAAGDGNGRDSDASDPGDFCVARGSPSSWHGTHVAGTIGAATNNGIGVAGVAPNVKLQTVRVLGRCGGTIGDTAEAIVWAAGGAVAGVPTNPTPAKVINLSLGGPGVCSFTEQNAINQAIALGASVVVAAGNESMPVSQFSPASCSGVIAVHAHTKFSDYADYSNFGAQISISGPGGQTSSAGARGADGGVLSTLNSGTQGPAASSYGAYQGTSMAAPHVAGVAALISTVFPSYNPATIKDILRSSARPFPQDASCSLGGGCGPGMLDAENAVEDLVYFILLFEGSGSVSSSPAGLTCTEDCAYRVDYSSTTTYTLTATPAAGHVFVGWAGACTGNSTCPYTPTGAKIVVARFALAGSLVPLSVSKTGNGFGTISSSPQGLNCGSTCSFSFGSGAVVRAFAVANANSVFTGWNGACTGTVNPCVVSMTAARSLSANFVWLDDFPDTAGAAVTIQPSSSTPASLYSGNDQDWFRVNIPAKGRWIIQSTGTTDTVGDVYAPDGVTLFGSNDDFAAPPNFNFGLAFTVPVAQSVLIRVTGYKTAIIQTTGPYTLVSSFVPTQTLSVTKQGTGAGSVSSTPTGLSCGTSCSAEFDTNAVVNLTVAANAGSTFAGWGGACAGTTTCQVTMDSAKTVVATFNTGTGQQPQSITFANPGAQTFGTTPTLSATASSGLTVTFTSATTGVCNITSGGTLNFVSVGTCTINADQTGNAFFLAAAPVSQSFTVNALPIARPDRVVLRENNPAVEVSVVANDQIAAPLVNVGVLSIATAPTRGTASVLTRGTASVLDDAIRYTPNANTAGTDTLVYRVCFGGASPCADAQLTIEVRPLATAALEFDTSTDRGFRDQTLTGLRALPTARFEAHGLVAPVVTDAVMNDISGAGAPWGAGRTATVVRTLAAGTAARDWRVLLDARSLSGNDLDLYLGIDSNGNGVAEAAELVCSAAMASNERCDLAVTAPGNGSARYWVLAHSPLVGQTARLEIFETALDVPATNRTLVATAPGALAAGESFPVRLAWNDATFLPGQSRGGWLQVRADDSTSLGWVPVRINRTAGEPGAFALESGVDHVLALQTGAAHERLYIDVPPGATQLAVTTTSASNIDLYLARIDTQTASAETPTIPAAPARNLAVASAVTGSGNENLTVSNPAAGRWYVTPVNASAGAATLTVRATVIAVAPVVRAGGYFNPQRSGNGLFLYPAGTELAGLWYTYLQDGSPTWYYMQAAAPGSNGLWRGTIFRSAWNGSSNRLTVVGQATVTPTSTGAFTFNYTVDGETGSEAYSNFSGSCPTVNGASLDISGHWFDPLRSGTGYSVQSFPNYEFYLVFGYDARGVARYLVAERSGFGGTTETLTLEQLRGVCPLCTRTGNPTRSTVGTLQRRIEGGTLRNITLTATYVNSVPGTWAANDAVIPLGGLRGCAP